MADTVIVLGAAGKFGRAAVDAFSAAGWNVTALLRNDKAHSFGPKVRIVRADVLDTAALSAACEGHDVIIHAVHPPYERWSVLMPKMTQSVIAAASKSGATVLIPGNVYNYGTAMPSVLTEDTPHRPDTKKGALREDMERAFEQAADIGVQTIILRAGDFIENEKSGNWFDLQITPQAKRGKTEYPGRRDQPHAWAYLPDLARGAEGLARIRHQLAPFEMFGFEGFTLTGQNLVAAIERVTGVPQRVSRTPWWIIRLMGLFSPAMGELMEMRYLWNKAHRINGNKFAKHVPDFLPTPLDEALRRSM
ncbi:MAG: NAD(P)H-binding protein [Pseudomonadota bacterium]